MARLKGVIFGVENVLIKKGDQTLNTAILNETGRLVRFLAGRGIVSVVVTNRTWEAKFTDKSVRPLKGYLEEVWGTNFQWLQCASKDIPSKQSGGPILYACQQNGWQPNETLFIGNTEEDMQ